MEKYAQNITIINRRSVPNEYKYQNFGQLVFRVRLTYFMDENGLKDIDLPF